MNTVENFRGGVIGDQYVDLYFQGAATSSGTATDKVRLTVTNDKEDEVLTFLGDLMPTINDGGHEIANDKTSVYVHADITAVSAITLANDTYYRTLTTKTANYTLLDSDSGSIVMVNPAATTALTLPTISSAIAGWNVKVVVTEGIDATATGMDQIVNIHAGSGNDDFIGVLVSSGSDDGDYAVSGDDYINFTDSAGPGSMVEIFTDGTRWYVHGMSNSMTHCKFNSAAAA
tara:strand:+ start:163 stop:855 length:693 start_codon:yes stop_codon:yes gene_type:complete